MEPEGLLSCLQQSATCPYSEPDHLSTYSNLISLKLILILFFHLVLGFQSDLFPSVSPTILCMHLSPPPYVPHAPLIESFSWSRE